MPGWDKFWGKYHRWDPSLILGDVGNGAYAAMQIAEIAKPSLAHNAAFSTAATAIGTAGGGINILVGLYCFTQAIQAGRDLTEAGKKYMKDYWYIGAFFLAMAGQAPEDVEKFMRLLWDSVCLVAIGVIMILAALSVIAMPPWVLPVLWFLITIPLLLEVAKNNYRIDFKKDKAAQLKLDQLENLLEEDNINWERINNLYTEPDNPFNLEEADRLQQAGKELEAANKVSERMQELQVSMGPEAAIEAMKLKQYLMLNDRVKASAQLEILKRKIKSWNFAQRVRLAQQVVLAVSLIPGLLLLYKPIASACNLATNGLIFLGSGAIPGAMDVAWPFKRNVYVVVPKAEADKVIERANQAREEALSRSAKGSPVHSISKSASVPANLDALARGTLSQQAV